MNNASPANATALPDRRRFLTAGAAAAYVAVPVAAVAATQDNQDDFAISLWEKRSALKPLFVEAKRKYREAEALLPWWAKPGPRHLNHDGSFSGHDVGWPAIQDMEPPDRPGFFKIVRPGKGDIEWGLFSWTPEEARSRIIRKRRSELAARLRAKRSELRRAGVLAAEWTLDALDDQIDAIDNMVDELSPSTPNATAVLVLREALFHASIDDQIDSSPEFMVALKALEFLRPQLRGIVKDHVDDLLDNPDQPVKWCKAYLYEDQESEKS